MMITKEEIGKRLKQAWDEAYVKERKHEDFTDAVYKVAELQFQNDNLQTA